MKAPDKIYRRMEGKWIGYFENRKPAKLRYDEPSPVEYIRKDALLEWAKEEKKQTEGLIKQYSGDESLWAEMHWYEELIDKINSL